MGGRRVVRRIFRVSRLHTSVPKSTNLSVRVADSANPKGAPSSSRSGLCILDWVGSELHFPRAMKASLSEPRAALMAS
jgi:hypothetical protein